MVEPRRWDRPPEGENIRGWGQPNDTGTYCCRECTVIGGGKSHRVSRLITKTVNKVRNLYVQKKEVNHQTFNGLVG